MYHKGEKYEEVKNKDITDIAKIIRKDLKVLPYKTSVVCERFAHGQALTVKVYLPYDAPNKEEIEKEVDSIIKDYQYSESDWRDDSHSNNFFSHIRFVG